jgi:integrase
MGASVVMVSLRRQFHYDGVPEWELGRAGSAWAAPFPDCRPVPRSARESSRSSRGGVPARSAASRYDVSGPGLRSELVAANEKLAKGGARAIDGATNHSLRRTFASLLYEAGASPVYVMA